MQLIILLCIIKLSFGWDDPMTVAFNGEGTRIYKETGGTNPCTGSDPTSACVTQGTTANFYGPFQGESGKGINHAVQVACNEYSFMDISYNVASCGVAQPADTKAKTVFTFDNDDGNKQTGYFGEGATNAVTISDTALSSASSCTGAWTSTPFTFTDYGPVKANQPVEIKIRDQIRNTAQFAAAYGLQVTCNPTRCTGDCGYTATPPSVGAEFCLEGFPDPEYDGEYTHIETLVNGKDVWTRSNQYGDAYLVANGPDPGNGNDGWAIVDSAGSPGLYQYICVQSISTVRDIKHLGFPDTWTWKGSNGVISDTATVTNGKCTDHYNANIFGISDQMQMILMLGILSLGSCILGMMTLYCCQLVCCNKNRNYRKVAYKDVDIDF